MITAKSSLSDWLIVVPLLAHQRWLAWHMPTLILVGLITGSVIPSFMSLAMRAGLPIPLFVLATSLGVISGLGAGTYAIAGKWWLSLGVLTAYTIGLWQIFEKASLTIGYDSLQTQMYLGIVLALILVPYIWLSRMVATIHQGLVSRTLKNRYQSRRASGLPWLLTAFFRKAALRTTTYTSLAIGAVLAIAIKWQGIPVGDGAPLVWVASLLVAISITDLRGLAETHNPPEIVAIRGTSAYLQQLVLAAYLYGTLIALPFIYLAVTSGASKGQFFVSLVIHLALAVALGTLIGSILVPTRRDISGQFLAGLLCLGGLLGLAKLPVQISQPGDTGSLLLLVTFVVMVFVIMIEKGRNNYSWRSN